MLRRMKNVVSRFYKEEDAPTIVEYGLLVALIAVICVAGISLLGTNLLAIFNSIAGTIGNAA